ncbi:YceI family protein [Streptomyces sp. NPDC001984]
MTTLQSSTETPLQPGTWTIDAAHSLVEFSVRHMTVARVTGRFGAVNGAVEVPPGDPLGATVRADIDVASVSAGHPKRDELIRSADFLDAETHPVITFTGGPAVPTADGRWNVPGGLTIKGVTRPVVLDTVFGGVISHRGAIRAGFSAATEINRKDFGVTWNAALDSGGAIVSDLVKITLEIELVLTQS